MKKLLFAVLVILSIGCTKKNKITRSSCNVSMDVDGVNCSFNSSSIKFGRHIVYLTSTISYNYLANFSITYPGGTYYLEVRMYNDSVIVGQTYQVSNQAGMASFDDISQSNSLSFQFIGKYSHVYNSDYNFYLTVDNISNNEASGHFQGLMICNAPTDTLHITNGQFSNVPIEL